MSTGQNAGQIMEANDPRFQPSSDDARDPEEWARDMFLETVEPYLATDEGHKFLQGMNTQEAIRALLVQDGGEKSDQAFRNLILRFMWEEITPHDFQVELLKIFTSNASVQSSNIWNDLSPILKAPTESKEEQAIVKKKVCDLLGLVTQPRDPPRPSLEYGMQFMHDVEARFRSQSGKYKELLYACSGNWRGQSLEEARAKQNEVLQGEWDLMEPLAGLTQVKPVDKGDKEFFT